MFAHLRQFSNRRCLTFLLLLGAGTAIFVGCTRMSPFLAAQFNQSLLGLPGGVPPTTNPSDNNNGNDNSGVVSSVCDLDAGQQVISISIQNASQQFAKFSLTFAVSAGPGGFVCDDQVQDYLNAGFSDAIVPGSGQSAVIGCDTISLASGNRILTMQFGSNQGPGATLAPNVGGDPNATLPTLILRRRDNGSALLPLPELIIFGNADADFICTGGAAAGDLCTQRGFVYASNAGLPVGKSAEASRIQGTVCAENFGSAPEWRLDKTLDAIVQPFQYGRGGAIVATILDRAGDDLSNGRNQVVWLVTDADDNTLHFPQD